MNMIAFESKRVATIKSSPSMAVSIAAKAMRAKGEHVVDLSLGEHGGLDVLQHLAQLKFDAPIIVVSGSDDKVREEALMVARRLGLNVCGSFGKPMNLSHLRNLLGEIRKRQLVGLTPRGS